MPGAGKIDICFKNKYEEILYLNRILLKYSKK